MKLPSTVQKNIDAGRSIGIAFEEYVITEDKFVKLGLFIEPADLPVMEKYLRIEKVADYLDPLVQEQIREKPE